MLGRTAAVTVIGAIVTAATSVSADTIGLAPSAGWAQRLGDGDIADLRGGFGGLGFSVHFAGGFERLGHVEGHLGLGAGGDALPTPQLTLGDDQVNISTHIGNFQGASGIFQIAQVPGDFNIVNNNLYVQINLIGANGLQELLAPRMAELP